MTLPPGARLGPYVIVAPLGAGGMGEVYRARDGRLNRDVAVKVLPAAFVQSPDRLARFDQEARAAAALNHPNVMTVFDVSTDGDVPYVVSELLEGETLYAAVARGALPLRRATDLAVQIALGLAAAHQKGIVHRDLKPANIWVTTEGRAKILDFGLARVVDARDELATATRHAAATPLTRPGAVMGSAGYMSPEQVRGEAVDHRTDIFAFGAVCYEMLSGRRAFSGDSDVETMAAILKQDPPDLPPGALPGHLERMVRRCLEKQPEQRFQSASDIAYALEATSGTPSGTQAIVPDVPARSRWRAAAMLAAALAVAAAAGGLAVRWATAAGAQSVTFEPKTFDRLPIMNARFMPDGQTVVYSAAPRGYAPELFVIRPTDDAPEPLGVADAHLLAVSSKGELALIVNARHLDQRLYRGTLARMPLGSSPRALLENIREADWGPDGESMAVVHDLGNDRDRLEYPIGTAVHEASGYLSEPRVSPDGTRVAFFEHAWRYDDRGRVMVADRAGRVTALSEQFWSLEGLAWSSDGSTIVFSGNQAGGSLMQPMSVAAAGGRPVQPLMGAPGRLIVRDIARDGRWLAVREDLAFGVRAQVPGREGERDLSWLGSTGARSLSADGQWLLMVDVGVRGGPDYGVVLRKTDGSQAVRLGTGNAQKLSPDGKWAAAIIAQPAQLVVYPTGPGETVRFPGGPLERLTSAEWFPDSRRLMVCGSAPSQAPRCYGQEMTGAPPVPLTDEGVTGTVAPDGKTLLLLLADGSRQTSSLDAATPRSVTGLRPGDRVLAWSRDSRAVFVQQGYEAPARIERVDLTSGARSLVREVMPQGVGALALLVVTDWVDEGRWYAYNYTAVPSTLFIVSGAVVP